MPNRSISADVKAAALLDLGAGAMTRADIAAKHAVSLPTVHNWARTVSSTRSTRRRKPRAAAAASTKQTSKVKELRRLADLAERIEVLQAEYDALANSIFEKGR